SDVDLRDPTHDRQDAPDGSADGSEDGDDVDARADDSERGSERPIADADGDPDAGELEDVDLASDLPPPPSEGGPGSLARFDPMAAYLREVQRHPLLTPEETHELATRFIQSQDPNAAAQLVTSNLRLVVKIAYEYRRAYKNIMDLVQEGN